MTRHPRVCVVGVGAVGGLIAAKLAQAGYPVDVLARGEHLRAIEANGLALIEGQTRATVRVATASDPTALGPHDVVFIAFKAPSLVCSAGALTPLLGPDTVLVPAMNGVPWWFFHRFGGRLVGTRLSSVDPGGAISRSLPAEQVIGSVVHLSSSIAAPGVIRRGFGNVLIVGEPSGERSGRLARVIKMLEQGGFTVKPTPEIQREVWLKLWGNMNMNPISALTGSTADAVLDDPLTAQLVRDMMEEAAAVGRALGIEMSMTASERIAVTRELGAFKTSMLQDLESGRPLEIDAILGAPCEIGDRLGIPMPFSKAVLGLTRQRARNLGLYAYEAGGPTVKPLPS
ncbi:MAG: 2-dehydropantoate 2-reductase [Candidatus Rokuibacteriota bacterium]|nr:MAG: 2-dehydropantoate 2-reductase [Candidatus Rokubacteria bacterium]PYN07405.1 MAG: 2-dehydropantoate 2-reductase [Candidatus Rokubacteria bacterium]